MLSSTIAASTTSFTSDIRLTDSPTLASPTTGVAPTATSRGHSVPVLPQAAPRSQLPQGSVTSSTHSVELGRDKALHAGTNQHMSDEESEPPLPKQSARVQEPDMSDDERDSPLPHVSAPTTAQDAPVLSPPPATLSAMEDECRRQRAPLMDPIAYRTRSRTRRGRSRSPQSGRNGGSPPSSPGGSGTGRTRNSRV